MSAPTATEKKSSKFKFSSLLHPKDKDSTTTPPSNPQRNSNSDSGYGGSEPSYTEPYNQPQNIPPSLNGSDESRSYQFQTQNPNDQNATVTTTTTTTTTTTSGGNLNTSIENNAPQQNNNQLDYNGRNEQTGSGGGGSPPIPIRSSLRDRSPNPPATVQGGANSGIRDRSPNPGTSPSGRTNFSYPNRGPYTQSASQPPMTQQQQQQAQQSTLQGLKSAAVGIHGASETLRGTINSAVDRHTHAPADVLAEHDRTIAGGRQEMERMQEARANQPNSNPNPNTSQVPVKGILKKVGR
ncbi:MAG: hypothetical protein L6R41_006864 [Letrouitia leprolyta]|nr:MAG: hypothetical protein L6R41_006864 [Letrouitia leprolyta]